MKKHIIFIIFSILVGGNLFAQTATLDYASAVNKLNEAEKLLDKADDESDAKPIIEELNSAIDFFKSTKSRKRELTMVCDYHIYQCYIDLYSISFIEIRDGNAQYLEMAIQLWPFKEHFPKAVLTSTVKYEENGKNMEIDGISEKSYEFDFYNSRYYMAEFFYFKYEYAQAMEYILPCLEPQSPHETRFACANMAATIYSKQNMVCRAGQFAKIVISEANYLDSNATNAKKMETNLGFISEARGKGCFSLDTTAWFAESLLQLNASWKKYYFKGFVIADSIYKTGYHNLDFMMQMLKFSRSWHEPTEAMVWQDRIDKGNKKYAWADWDILSDFYYKIGDTKRYEMAQRKRKSYSSGDKGHGVAFAINPFNIIDNQFVLATDFINENVIHEVRYDFAGSSTQLILTGPGDSVGKMKTSIKYKGYQIGYSLKILTSINKGAYFYYGPELRYADKQYLDSILVETKTKKPVSSLQDLNAKGNNYELSINFGYFIRHRRIFIDLYGGIGAGYKTLATDIDPTAYKIIDYRYKDEHWNKIYPFPRAGIRVGIIF